MVHVNSKEHTLHLVHWNVAAVHMCFTLHIEHFKWSLQLASPSCVRLQGISFGWLVGLVFLLECTEDEATLHSFPTNFEPKPGDI